MMKQFRTALFLVFVFTVVHFQSIIVDGLNEIEDFSVRFTALEDGESCSDETVESVVMVRGKWNPICVDFEGEPERAFLLDADVILVGDYSNHSLSTSQVIIDRNQNYQPNFFKVYIPGDIDSETSEIRYEWKARTLDQENVIGGGNVSLELILPLVESDYSVGLANEANTIGLNSKRPIGFDMVNFGDEVATFTTLIFDEDGNEIGNYSDKVGALGTLELAIPVESNGLGLGIHELTAITHANGSSNSDDVEFIFDLEVVAPTPDIEINFVDWNGLQKSQAMHPNQEVSVLLNLTNYASMNSTAELGLTCYGENDFTLFNNTLLSEKLYDEIIVNFTTPNSEKFGTQACFIHNDGDEIGLTVREFTPWPVESKLMFSDINTSVPELDAILSTSDERIIFDASITNLGNSVEDFYWNISATSIQSGESVLLKTGTSVVLPDNYSSISVNRTISTCDSGLWNLGFEVTDRYGDVQSETLLGAFNTTRAPIPASVSIDNVGEPISNNSGLYLPIDVTVEGMNSNSECSQLRPVEIAIQKVDGSEIFADISHITVRPGITSTYRIDLPIDRLSESGELNVIARILDGVGLRSECGADCDSLPWSIFIESEEKLASTECDVTSQSDTLNLVVSCESQHPMQRSVSYKLQLSVNEEIVDEKISWLSPGEEEIKTFTYPLSGWGSHNISVDTYILSNGQWVEQTSNFSTEIITKHRLDGKDFISHWSISPHIPSPGKYIRVDLDVVGTSQDIAYIHITIEDAGAEGVPLTGNITVEDISIGVLRTHSIHMLWPASCDYFKLTIEAFTSAGHSKNLPLDIDNNASITACPPQLPDYVVSNIETNNDEEVTVTLANIGTSVDASVASSASIYGDGKLIEILEVDGIPHNSSSSFVISSPFSFNLLTVVVDSEGDICESQEGSANIFSKNLDYEVNSFVESDINRDGMIDVNEQLFSNVRDSDGDGLDDETELIGWTVTTIQHLDELKALSEMLDNAEDGDITEPPQLTEIEVKSSTGSIDSDDDGLTDYGEMVEGTNPYAWDSDGDGLSDLVESLDANQDPLVVELDAPEIQALAPKVVGEALLGYYTTYEILFEVKEENIEHIEIHIDRDGDVTKEVAIEENSQDYITDFDGKLFSVQYTLDVAFWDDTVVNAVVTDKFGQKTEVAIANHSSLKSRVTTSLVNLAAGISEFFGGALATGIAGFTGFVYGVFTVLKDTVDMVISVGKFLVKLAKDFFDVIKSLAATAWDLITDFDFDEFVGTVKKVAVAIYDKAKSLSPFTDKMSNNTFLGMFILTFIAGTLAIEAMFGAGMKTANGLRSGGNMGDFFTHMGKSMTDMKSSVGKFAKSPIGTIKGWIKAVVSIPKKIIFGLDNLFSNLLIRGAVSSSSFSVIFQVIGKGYVWFGKKLNLDGAYRLSRGLDFMSSLKKSSKFTKIKPKVMKEGLKAARAAVKHPDLFKAMNGFDNLKDGSKMQKAAMGNLVDSIFTSKGKLNTKNNLKGALDELSQVGSVVLPDGSRITTVAPGKCKACDSLDGKNDFDRDLVRTKYDADGNIVSKEIVDRKHYSDASNVRDEIAKNVKKRNGKGVVDYQKEQFNRYLPDTPENRQKYVDDMAKRTGMSEADALKNYDFDKDWVAGKHNKIESKYEPIIHDKNGKYKNGKHEITSTEKNLGNSDDIKKGMEERYFGENADCAPCKDMTPEERSAFIDDMYNAEYGVKGVSESGGKQLYSIGDEDSVSAVLAEISWDNGVATINSQSYSVILPMHESDEGILQTLRTVILISGVVAILGFALMRRRGSVSQ